MGILNCKPRGEDAKHSRQPYVGRKFFNEQKAKKFYQAYARNTGFIVREERGRMIENTGILLTKTFACEHEGCEAKMCIGRDLYMHFFSVYFVVESHNHPLSVNGTVSALPTFDNDSIIKREKVYEFMRQNEALARNDVGKVGEKGEQSIEILSWEPRAFLYHNFLSEEECKHLINLGKSHMVRSRAIDNKTGQPIVSSSLTSFGMALNRRQDEIVSEIEKRIAEITRVPKGNGANLHVLRYEVGQKVDSHYDYSISGHNVNNGGQCIATFLMYLSDVEEGGETIFPCANGNDIKSHSVEKGLVVKPKMGDALLFWSLKPDGTLDPSSLHGSCPVTKGTKWVCTQRMHVDRYRLPVAATDWHFWCGDRLLLDPNKGIYYE